MEFLALSAPYAPYLKVLGPFALMLAGIRLGLNLAVSALLGSLLMGALFGMSPVAWLTAAGSAMTHEKFLLLLVIVSLILIFSDTLQRTGQSERLTALISGSGHLRRPRTRLIFFPILIGLLPMPGGAVFSAPMVRSVSAEMSFSEQEKALLNYWFRHVWEIAWPLYPGIILTVALAGIHLSDFLVRAWPSVALMLGIGWFFFLRKADFGQKDHGRAAQAQEHGSREILRAGAPLLIAIGGAIGLETLISTYLPQISFEWGVIAGMILAIGAILFQNNKGISTALESLKSKNLWSMLAVITAVFIFKEILLEAKVIDKMAAAGEGIALFSAAVALPFLVGVVAGITVAYVGATFPLLIGLLQSLGMESQMIPYLILATFFGFTGVMVSPIHICFVLTCRYFATNLATTWRRLVAPSLALASGGVALFWLYL